MRENRRSKRYYVREWARALLDGEQSPVNCVLLDISDTGARVMIPNTEVPDTFFLFRKKDRSLREATVVRRGNQSVGVRLAPPLDPEGDDARRLMSHFHLCSQ